jgi:glycosyltransferase involved in cell wall biosynthesis
MGGDKGWEKPDKIRNVVHLGYVRDPEKQAMVYGAADVFLCTTLADAQPQTALESLACGIPLIAFDVGPMPDLAIEGKTGFIACEKTYLSLGQVIMKYLNLSDHWLKMRENCRKEALTRFDLEQQTNKYLDLYEGILEYYPA